VVARLFSASFALTALPASASHPDLPSFRPNQCTPSDAKPRASSRHWSV
jgi:hypothetical protein